MIVQKLKVKSQNHNLKVKAFENFYFLPVILTFNLLRLT